MYAVDRRGRGVSGNINDYAIEQEYADIAAVVEDAAAQDGSVTLLGHSYGAIISPHAVLETDAVDQLLLYEPPLGHVTAPVGFADELESIINTEGNEKSLMTFLQDGVGMTDEKSSSSGVSISGSAAWKAL